MPELLIATNNLAKFDDFKQIINSVLPRLKIVSLADLNIKHEVDEPFFDAEQNAIKKVKEYYELARIPTLSDDGGLEIDILNGEPGARAKRWAGHEMSDDEIIAYTLERLRSIPLSQRTATLFHVAALALNSDNIYTTRHEIKGVILEEARNDFKPGFPFRALFYIPQFKKHILDLTSEEYQQINHREKAVNEFKKYLENIR